MPRITGGHRTSVGQVEAPRLDVLLSRSDVPDVPRTGDRLAADPAEGLLTALYAWSPAPRRAPAVRANMIASLDGAATGADGRSGSINGPADLRVFTVLRALADVVLVGAGTVRAEGYGAPRTPAPLLPGRRERGQAEHPALAVVTASGDVPQALLGEDPAPWVFTTAQSRHLGRLRDTLPDERLTVHDGSVDLALVVAALGAARLPAVLTEGGPRLLGTLLEDDLVDEVCLTTAPRVVGGRAARVVDGIGWLEPPRPAALVHLLHGDGMLITRWALRHG